MTKTIVKPAALLALLFVGAAMGEAPPGPSDPKKPAEEKKPSQLEELLAQALRDNPDVRVAESKVREAEAELNRTRLQVIQKVVIHQHTIETLTSAVRVAEASYAAAEAKLRQASADYERLKALKGAATPADLELGQVKIQQARADIETARAALQSAKADVAKAQAELPYLLGKGTKTDQETREAANRALYWLSLQKAGEAWQRSELATPHPQGTVPDKIRKALDGPISLKVEQVPLSEVLALLQDKSGAAIVPTLTLPRDLLEKKLILNVNNISLGAAFQMLEDIAGVRFAVRDYGILVTDKLPPGVMPLHDFWKGGEKAKAAEEKPKSDNKEKGP
jgi:hypothetical protein